MTPSKSQIDRLGDRLRAGDPTEADLRELDAYRRSFANAYQEVVQSLERLGYSPSGRPAKSTSSIVEKLRRESIRLSQMQDIAGCRILLADTKLQQEAVQRIRQMIPTAVLVDRIRNPSHGYRALHVVVNVGGLDIEIQVRTVVQHRWAQLSELLADKIGSSVKYGGGYREVQETLASLTAYANLIEVIESEHRVLSSLAVEAEQVMEHIQAATLLMNDAIPAIRESHQLLPFEDSVKRLETAARLAEQLFGRSSDRLKLGYDQAVEKLISMLEKPEGGPS